MALERLAWLTGPVFERELRTASRRRWGYFLRFAYLAVLTVYVYGVWRSRVGPYRSMDARSAYQMAEVGRAITSDLMDFQFVLLPLLAAVMLSGSIGEEVRRRTLGTLMVTPVSGLRLVLGILLSRILQLALLAAISLPVLMVVRAFGGVDWSRVVGGVALCLTTCILCGSVALVVSTFLRRAYAALPATAAVLVAAQIAHVYVCEALEGSAFHRIVLLANPIAAMESFGLWNRYGVYPSTALLINVPLCLGLSALLLAWAGRRARKIGLRVAMGELRPTAKWERVMRPRLFRKRSEADPIRRITGLPMVWRERKVHFGPSRFAAVVVAAVIAGTVGVFDYVGLFIRGADPDGSIFSGGCEMLFILAMLATMIQAAPALASEAEAGTLPLLLASPLSRTSIVFGKAFGVFLRSFPVWGLLLAHVLLFVLFGRAHPSVLLQVPLVVMGVLVFLAGAGLLISAFARRATLATVAGLIVLIALLTGPFLVLFFDISPPEFDRLMLVHPLSQTEVLARDAQAAMTSALTRPRELTSLGVAGWVPTTILAGVSAALHVTVGLLLGWAAGRCLSVDRRNWGIWITQRDWFIQRRARAAG